MLIKFAFIDIRCDDLLAPANGGISFCSSGRVGVGYEGDTCRFTCNTGYEVTGSDIRTCHSDGSWNDIDDIYNESYSEVDYESSGNYKSSDGICRRGKFIILHIYIYCS